jgi:hypothetical protein
MNFEKKILLNGPDDGTGIVWPILVVPHVIVIVCVCWQWWPSLSLLRVLVMVHRQCGWQLSRLLKKVNNFKNKNKSTYNFLLATVVINDDGDRLSQARRRVWAPTWQPSPLKSLSTL